MITVGRLRANIHSVSRTSSHLKRYSTNIKSDPLRILFCGSDAFSIASLEALHKEHQRDPGLIASIDVVCRRPRPTGRGLKSIRPVPILSVAKSLSLPVHEIGTFTGWTPPKPHGERINLIAAVSFGLLIPARIIDGARYGGVNVHPSLLPNFRGAAPLHHTLLSGTDVTGVTLQSLHPTRFDHGIILTQTPPIKIRAATVPELERILAPRGSELLLQGIRDHVYLELSEIPDRNKAYAEDSEVLPAPKISPADRHIDWNTWTAEKILRRHRVIGPLWNNICRFDENGSKSTIKRLIWDSGFRKLPKCPESIKSLVSEAGGLVAVGLHSENQSVYIKTCDGHMLQAYRVKMEGDIGREFLAAARRVEMIELPKVLDEVPCDYKLLDVVLR